ncbi:hypothetical protein GQ53DRAFT_842095 [Thozetella sp. PMI_491]|nr:hypothetical protein GQ53DRAFT_842095 [Thozetella sp. PMI_491]
MDPGQLFNQLMGGALQPVDNSFILPYHHQQVGHFGVGNDVVLGGWIPGDYSLVDNISGAGLSSQGPMLHPISEFDHVPSTDPSSSGVDGSYFGSDYAALDLTPGASQAQAWFNKDAVLAGTDVRALAAQPVPTFSQDTLNWPVALISSGDVSNDLIQANTADIGFVTATLEDGLRAWSPPLGLDLGNVPLRQCIPGICQPEFGMYQEHDSTIPEPAATNTALPLIPIVDWTHGPPIHDSRRRKKVRKKTRSNAQLSPTRPTGERAKGIDWASWLPKLQHWYIEEGHTAEELAFSMWAIMGQQVATRTLQNNFSKQPGFQKNGKTGVQAMESLKKKRKRPAHSLPDKDELKSFFTFTRRLSIKLITDKEGIIRSPSSSDEPYVHQFKMLHAIDGLVKMFFDTKRPKSRSTAATSFVPSRGTANDFDGWQMIYHRCVCLKTVLGASRRIGAMFIRLLRLILDDVYEITKLRTPNFLVYLWRICMALMLPIRGRWPLGNYLLPRIFLLHIKSAFERVMKPNEIDDSVLLIDSLLRVLDSSPLHFKATLGIGCWKVLAMMGEMMGRDHIGLIAMGMNGLGNWPRHLSVDEERLQSRCNDLVVGFDSERHSIPTAMDDLYYYVSAMFDRASDKIPDSVTEITAKLRAVTRELLCRSDDTTYDSIARAFALSTEKLAFHHIFTKSNLYKQNSPQREEAFSAMDDAIEILRHRDVDCRINALQLSCRLWRWSRAAIPHSTDGKIRSQKESARASHIAQSIGQTVVPGAGRGFSNYLQRRKECKQIFSSLVLDVWTNKYLLAELEGKRPVKPRDLSLDTPNQNKKAQVVPTQAVSSASPEERTCCHCSELFGSRNLLFRHAKEQHPEKWGQGVGRMPS